jgi:membrane-associated phospholipid phosphatase
MIFEEPRRTGRRRLGPALVGLALTAGFLILGLDARDGRVPGWDRSVWSFLHGHEEAAEGTPFDHAVNLVLQTDAITAGVVLALALVLILLRTRRVRDAWIVVTTVVATIALTPLLKEPFERANLKYSFPSGHAAASAALVSAIVLVAWPTRFRWAAVAVGALLTAAFGTLLVYENWHLPSDVLGGWCLGIVCALATRAAFTRFALREQ